MIRQRYRQSQGFIALKKQGVKPRLGPEMEEKLAGYIKHMAELGFGPTLNEMTEIVGDYLMANEPQQMKLHRWIHHQVYSPKNYRSMHLKGCATLLP